MFQYYLPQERKIESMCIEGLAVFKDIKSNQMRAEKYKKFDKFIVDGSLHYREIDSKGTVIFDSAIKKKEVIVKEVKKPEVKEEIKVVKKTRKPKTKKEEVVETSKDKKEEVKKDAK